MTTPSSSSELQRSAFRVLSGAFAIAVGAWIDVPMVPVPMTLQTWAVLAAGGLLGARRGPLAVVVYLLAAALGLPVLAGFGSGLERLTGPTAGYLVGFVAAAWMAGRAANAGFALLLAAMLAGHAVVLGLGVAWLAWSTELGIVGALSAGMTPFLVGAVVKSLFATVTVRAVKRWGEPSGHPFEDSSH